MADPVFFSNELENAIRTEASAAMLRLEPEADLHALFETLKGQNTELELGENGLTVKGATNISAKDVLVAASKADSTKKAFVTKANGITHLDHLSKNPLERAKQATEYVKLHGEEGWRKLVQDSSKPALRADVIVSSNMSRDDWQNLRLSEKTKAIAMWGSQAEQIIGQILRRKAVAKK